MADRQGHDLQARIAELQRANTALEKIREEQSAALTAAQTREAALAEVLTAIKPSLGDPQSVFELILEKAHQLCGADIGAMVRFDGTHFQLVVSRGYPESLLRMVRAPYGAAGFLRDLIAEIRTIHIPDLQATDPAGRGAITRGLIEIAHIRTHLIVPLHRDGALTGFISAGRLDVRPFSASEVSLLESFAAQAVIAMENARLINEQRDALERQTAMAELLEVINTSPGDVTPVFEAILEKAHKLCGVSRGNLAIYQDGHVRALATRGTPDTVAAALRQPTLPSKRHQQLIAGARLVHVADIEAEQFDPGNAWERASLVYEHRRRTGLWIPLRKDGAVLGWITSYRSEVRPFSDMEISLLESFAAQAVIAIENTRLITEQREALEQQTATAEVLGVINASPGNLEPVYDALLEKALRLTDSVSGSIFTYDGHDMRRIVERGAPAAWMERTTQNPVMPFGSHHPASAVLTTRRPVVIPDLTETEAYKSGHEGFRARVRLGAARASLNVPLVREDAVIGLISVYRPEPGAFSDKEITLLQNFAAQAVIAMENARLITEQREALEQQTATAEVLGVINASPGNLDPVFQTMLDRAMHLCGADFGELHIYDGARFHTVALHGVPQAFAEHRRRYSLGSGAGSASRRMLDGEDVIHVPDLMAEEVYKRGDRSRRAIVDLGGARSAVAVAMRKEGRLLGALNIYRQETGPYSERQIGVLKNFASQAVIAMENARLLGELRERTEALALRNTEFGARIEQQSATIDVLKVMAASPGDPQPVFNLIAERASAFCDAEVSGVATLDGGILNIRAYRGLTEDMARSYEAMFGRPPDAATLLGRAVLAEQPIQSGNLTMDSAFGMQQVAAASGMHSAAAVPMLRNNRPIGAISLARRKMGEFSTTQMELLFTFAEQAVIAITSAETYRTLQDRTAALALRNTEFGERIEQQSATIDVLKIMSTSPGDPQPVFDMIARRAQELCNGAGVRLVEFDGTLVHLRAIYGAHPAAKTAYEAAFPLTPTRGSVLCRAIMDQQVTHIRNMDTEPGLFAIGKNMGMKSVLAVPLMRDGNPIGAISIGTLEYGGFSDSQVALLQTFAEQAVIAITSAETYRALQDRTAALAQRNSEFGERIEHQAATIDVLKAMSASTGDAQPVFDLITARAAELCAAPRAVLFEYDGTLVHCRSVGGMDGTWDGANFQTYRRQFPMRLTRRSIACRSIMEGRIVHAHDIDADPEILQSGRDTGIKSVLSVPLMRDGVAMGAIGLNSSVKGGFTESQVALLQTFAEQAVIAITSAENHRALRARTEELTRSVSELHALDETIRAVNSSLDLDVVLATIISRAVQLSAADEGTIYEYDEAEGVFVPKAAHGMSADRVEALRQRRVRVGETHLGRSAAERRPIHVSDIQQDRALARDVANFLEGIHAVLAVPLLRDDKVIGGLVIRRRTAGDFGPSIPTLLQTFAGQSVLAIENARLLEQLAARGDEARRARVAAEAALEDLRKAQDRLVQTEKMASLGQLTAGVAHEIKNPLNFVNNFSDLSTELLDELNAAIAPLEAAADPKLRGEIDDLTEMLKGNLAKIAEHGRRADSIVKNMLAHSRTGGSERRSLDLNAIAEEALNLAYHGARAEFPGFNITLQKDLDSAAGDVELYPQEFTRVLLNPISNGFYATRKRAEQAQPGYEPTLRLSSRSLGDQLEITVRDNGTGIPESVRAKIFEPFFTTKPAGEGTGLGLSLSFDIIVKQHGGQLTVESEPGNFTEFRIILPRRLPEAPVGGGGTT